MSPRPEKRKSGHTLIISRAFLARGTGCYIASASDCGKAPVWSSGQVNPRGNEFRTPLRLEGLPTYMQMIVDDHVLNYPESDLIALLTGEKSFQEALDSPMLEGSE